MLFHTFVSSAYVVSTSYVVVQGVVHTKSVETFMAYYIITTYVLVATLCAIIFGFFCFHLYLLSNQYTTIEFCEKRSDSDS
jgi:hypothetical protein